MPANRRHPAPSPALHTLNTPERLLHDAAHPDNLVTSVTLMPDGPNCAWPGAVFGVPLTLPEEEGADNQEAS